MIVLYKVGNLIGDQYYKAKVSGINEKGQGSFSQLSPDDIWNNFHFDT